MLLCPDSEKGEAMWVNLWLCWREIHHILGWEHWKAAMGWEAQKRKKSFMQSLSNTYTPTSTCTIRNSHPLAPFLLSIRKASGPYWLYGSHAVPCKLYLTDPVASRAGRAASRNISSPACSGRLQHPLLAPMTHPPLNIVTSVIT